MQYTFMETTKVYVFRVLSHTFWGFSMFSFSVNDAIEIFF